MSKPLVSVVIPAYNAERFIEKTLCSALNQTYSELEVIVINDGSTDRTQSIVERFAAADSRLRQITTANGGVARARNIGIQTSSGDFVAFLDADDLWHPSKIAEQMSTLLGRDESWAACYVLPRCIDAEDRMISSARKFICSGYILTRHLLAKFVGNGSSLLVRRDAALAVGGFDPSYAARGIGGCEDFDFELKLAARYRVAALPLFLVGYRRYPGNMSSDLLRMAQAMVATIEQNIAANPSLPHVARRYARASAYLWAASLYNAVGKRELAARAFAQAACNDPVQNAVILERWIFRRLLRATAQAAHRNMPLFFDLEPSKELILQPMARALRCRLARLEAVDARLEQNRQFETAPQAWPSASDLLRTAAPPLPLS